MAKLIKSRKVALIGSGSVGSSYAYTLLNNGVVNELVIIDVNKQKAEGDVMDLNHGLPFGSPMKITLGDYEDCEDADLAVITAGLPQKPGETRLDLIEKNISVFRQMIPGIMKSGFDGIILVATNPVDVLSYITWKLSGLPKERVIGSGTTLDTARLRYMLGDYFQVDSRNIHAYVMGEHGDSEFVAWSRAEIASVPIQKWLGTADVGVHPDMKKIYNNVANAAYEIIKRKGATYYGIGMGLLRLTKAIFEDENSVLTVSALPEGQYGTKDVYIGVPAIVNKGGLKKIIEINLSPEELKKFQDSARLLIETREKALSRGPL